MRVITVHNQPRLWFCTILLIQCNVKIKRRQQRNHRDPLSTFFYLLSPVSLSSSSFNRGNWSIILVWMVHGCTMTSFGYFSVKKTVYNIIDWLTKCPAKRRRKFFLAIFGRLYLPKTKFCSLLFKKKYPRPPFKSTHQGIDLGQSCIAKCWSAKIELSVQWVRVTGLYCHAGL